MFHIETPWVSSCTDTVVAGCKLSFWRTSSRVTHSESAAPSGQGWDGGGGVVRNDTTASSNGWVDQCRLS